MGARPPAVSEPPRAAHDPIVAPAGERNPRISQMSRIPRTRLFDDGDDAGEVGVHVAPDVVTDHRGLVADRALVTGQPHPAQRVALPLARDPTFGALPFG